MRKAWALLIIPALFLLPGREFVFSQEAKKPAISSSEETLYQGELKSISVNTPTRVVIGKPEIADILSVSTKEIMVVGKGAGFTNLIWWDEKGEHHTGLKVLTEAMGYANSRVKDLIKELNLPQISTEPSDSEGKVLLLGSVKTKEDMDRVKIALGGLLPKTTNLIQIEEEKAIIELEVEVIEVDKGSTRDLGLNWLGSGGSVALTEPARWVKLANVPDSMFRISEWTHTQMTAALNLMVKEGKARVLSRPKLACQSGKEAELLVGGEKPIMTTQTSGTGGSSNTVEYKEYGIKLKMAPALNADGKIKLGLNVEVSDIGDAEILGSIAEPTAKAYPLTKRSTSTQLYLNNSQTLAISGLIKQKSEEQLRKFPWLGEVPVLGAFFRSRTSKKGSGNEAMGDTELVIMVTPSVVEDIGQNQPDLEKKSKIKAGPEEAAVPESESGENQAGKLEEPQKKSSAQEVATREASSPAKNKAVMVSRGSSFPAEKAVVPKISPPSTSGPEQSQKKSSAKKSAATKVSSPEKNKGLILSRGQPSKAITLQPRQASPAPLEQEAIPENPREEYIQQVIVYLMKNILYPWTAKQAKIEGTVVLNLHLAKSGDLLESNVGDSSGYSVLDENAIRIARQITPYPPFPRDISEEDFWIQIPVVYNIKEKR